MRSLMGWKDQFSIEELVVGIVCESQENTAEVNTEENTVASIEVNMVVIVDMQHNSIDFEGDWA